MDSYIIPSLFSPHKNGFLLFVLGIISILSIYHFLLFFQQKDKSYLLYSLYTLLLFIAYVNLHEGGFFHKMPPKISSFLSLTHQFWVWTYNIVYFYFALYFLNFKKFYPQKNKQLLFSLHTLLAIGFILLFYTILHQNNELLNYIYANIYTKVIIVITIWAFYFVLKIDQITKYYILSGSGFLFIGSLFAILVYDFGYITKDKSVAFFVFYIAIILENLCFSLALGLKQKIVSIEKNKTQKELIRKLNENKELKIIANNELQSKIKALNKQIKLKDKIDDLKLTVFKSQIKPHFIFNALNSIQLYINKNDTEKASHYLSMFSKLIRNVLEISSSNFVSLKEELEIVKLYINLENMRLLNTTETSFKVDKNIDPFTLMIPSLILQPFIENAFWHGLSTLKGKKKIDIAVYKKQERIVITITDNGIGRKASQDLQKNRIIKKKSMGIQFIQDKLETIYQKDDHIRIIDLLDEHENPKGTQVILTL